MKKIFVTVAEYLENGGELNLERPIFNIDKQNKHYQSGEFGGLHTMDGEMIIIKRANGSFPFYSNMCLVQIPCTPHYI